VLGEDSLCCVISDDVEHHKGVGHGL
jgi:hypothetical protein